MDIEHLELLLCEYKKAPEIFKAGRYWQAYEEKIVDVLRKVNLAELRSGRYPVFATFGFNEAVYHYRHDAPIMKTLFQKLVRKYVISSRNILPYNLNLRDIREMSFRHSDLLGQLNNARSLKDIEVSTFGNPDDLFKIEGKKYTMRFLTFYVRYATAQKYLNLKGDEVIVELGSGSGHQIEVLKKLYPGLTILCFDLPSQLFLCEQYLTKSLPDNQVISSSETLKIKDLNEIERGKVYMFGNWCFPLLKGFNFDIFWNAASFGEMEPDIVMNYINIIHNGCKWIYLLQAEHGKESTNSSGVVTPMNFDFYNSILSQYSLCGKEPAFDAHRRVSQSGGYFQGVWRRQS